MFANSEPVRGFEEGALQMCFADLRQCLLIQNLLEGLKKVHSRCALLILGRYDVRKMDFVLSVGRARQSNQLSE
ncbi:uncharacterized protein LOC143235331 isoform X4 [Tachypleus tridentatus]|uniref:uncharacterized protein LOC143235331 isoform X4 n=1 Tax=Tachypleus tridentatus TaxID=6853 RepID=UPI003FD2065E